MQGDGRTPASDSKNIIHQEKTAEVLEEVLDESSMYYTDFLGKVKEVKGTPSIKFLSGNVISVSRSSNPSHQVKGETWFPSTLTGKG